MVIKKEDKNISEIFVSNHSTGYKYSIDWKTEDQLLPAAKKIFELNKTSDPGIHATIILSLTSAIEGLIKLTVYDIKKGDLVTIYRHKYEYKTILKDLYNLKDINELKFCDPLVPGHFRKFFVVEANELNIPMNILFEFRNHIAHGKAFQYHVEKYAASAGNSNFKGLKKDQNIYQTYENVHDYIINQNLGDDIFSRDVIQHFIEKTEEFFREFKKINRQE